MKSTFKWLLVVAVVGATSILMQSVNGRPNANAMVRSTVGSAPQAIVMDTHAPTVESNRFELQRSRKAE